MFSASGMSFDQFHTDLWIVVSEKCYGFPDDMNPCVDSDRICRLGKKSARRRDAIFSPMPAIIFSLLPTGFAGIDIHLAPHVSLSHFIDAEKKFNQECRSLLRQHGEGNVQ